MSSERAVLRVKQRRVERSIEALEEYVRRFECRYALSSSDMAREVARGRHESPEIARWLTRYQTLQFLRDRTGRTNGTSTTTIEPRT